MIKVQYSEKKGALLIMEKTLVINSGSSSLKFKLYAVPTEEVLASGLIDRIGINGSSVTVKYAGKKYHEEVAIADHAVAVELLLELLRKLHLIASLDEITTVGHRVVAGGEEFDHSVVIDDEVIRKIDDLSDMARLHNPANLLGIKIFKKLLPNALAVASFDTAYHHSMPAKNYLYSVPYEWYEKYGVRRYGAHGISHRYVARQAAAMLQRPLDELKLISCHLGAGASLCAIKDGLSFDTTMGFTPLTGLTMATRSGDVDVELVNYMMKKLKITDPDEMISILTKDSGLLGVSGVSSDMRDVIAAKEAGNERAAMAVTLFVKNIVRYIGQYYVEMKGLDGIIFTAGIGENSVPIRQIVCDELAFMGVKLDPTANAKGGENIISTPDSTISVLCVPTDEELMISRDIEIIKLQQKEELSQDEKPLL